MSILNKDFKIKQEGNLRTLEIYLYGDIQGDYYNFWGDKIESKTSANYVKNALDKAGKVDNINIYIDSCGGSVEEGNAIFNLLKRADAVKTVYIDAFAFSVASVIAMAGDKIIMPSNSTMMIHNAMMSAYGTAEDLRKAATALETMNEGSCNTYLVKAGHKLTKEKLKELLDAETFLTAEQALEIGLCDEIANPVDLTQSAEIAEQAKKQNNPTAKKAIEVIQFYKLSAIGEKPEETPPEEKPEQNQDKFDWLSEFVNKNKIFKGE